MKRTDTRKLADEAYTILDDKCEVATERALSVLATAPNDPESYLLMAEVAEENERFDHALMWIDRGLKQHEDHEGLMLKKASILIDGFEDIDEAFVILETIKNHFSNKSVEELKKDLGASLIVDVYLLLTDCFRIKGDFNQALAHAELAQAVSPHDENVILATATAKFELGDYDSALDMITPIEKKADEPSDFLWLKAQILCAQGLFKEADSAFADAFKADKSRYHRPVRLDANGFAIAFEQALLALPREIREVVQSTSVTVADVVPQHLVADSFGSLPPQSCIQIEIAESSGVQAKVISIYQKNIENLASKKEEIKDLIASALLHELGKLAT